MTPEERIEAQLELVNDLEFEVVNAQNLGWGEEVWMPMLAIAKFLRERIADKSIRVDWESYK